MSKVPELPVWLESPGYVPVRVVWPAATAVSWAVQLPSESVQLACTVPTLVSEEEKLTVPVGVFEGVVVSGTVAVHMDFPPESMLLGLHAMLADVVSFALWLLLLFPLVVVGAGLVPCGEPPCHRYSGTPTAAIPARIRAMAPSLRLLGMFIFLFYLPCWVNGGCFWAGYIIQQVVQLFP